MDQLPVADSALDYDAQMFINWKTDDDFGISFQFFFFVVYRIFLCRDSEVHIIDLKTHQELIMCNILALSQYNS